MHSRNETGKSTYRCGAIIAYIDITNFFRSFIQDLKLYSKEKNFPSIKPILLNINVKHSRN